jgi:hypothetical protein
MTSAGQGDSHLVSIRSQRRLNCEDRLAMSVQAAIASELSCCGGEHYDLRADGDVVVKVGDVIVGQPDAAGGDVLADGPRLVGAWIRYSVSLLPCQR